MKCNETFTLNDGTVVSRVYECDTLEKLRIAALNKAGTVWALHPVNHIQKGAVVKKKEKEPFLTNYFTNMHKVKS